MNYTIKIVSSFKKETANEIVVWVWIWKDSEFAQQKKTNRVEQFMPHKKEGKTLPMISKC